MTAQPPNKVISENHESAAWPHDEKPHHKRGCSPKVIAVAAMEPAQPLLTDREAETLLKMGRGFLAKDRIGKRLIPFVKIGRAVRYRPDDVQAFIERSLHSSQAA